MGRSILKRLTLLLAVVAFVWATALPSRTVSAAPMPQGKHCGDCPLVKGGLGKMACGALACAGVAVGLLAKHASYLPMPSALVYAAKPVPETLGAAPAPDPFPPRPAVPG